MTELDVLQGPRIYQTLCARQYRLFGRARDDVGEAIYIGGIGCVHRPEVW